MLSKLETQSFAGKINTTGTIQFRATAIWCRTTLAKIVAFVSLPKPQPRIQGLADRSFAYFVPVVLAVALLTR